MLALRLKDAHVTVEWQLHYEKLPVWCLQTGSLLPTNYWFLIDKWAVLRHVT